MSEKNQPIKPTVVIDLPPILEAYCRFALDTPSNQDELVATRRNDIGKCINGFLSKSIKKPEALPAENPVVFQVPVTEYNQYSLFSKHLYICREDQEQIIDRIEVMFNQWIDVFFSDGYSMNFSQLDIIESVLDVINLRMNAVNFDQIKKRDYRKTKSDIRERSKLILKQRLSRV